ncbi:hypothetical protein [Pelomonas cellulosilytica]|uniref:J domain-containing protein n=1 Tax=Pelomonas cellulosilytica TaxID=2906762 RepID=A0ABS8XZM0_9BURK|nr:hypothetical protein [Pelomonas sp. P8]MCE4557317.1 hypothetical protein [Pelomonas sp. P8]
MWDEDWARLGIEPTTELAAIKKAYAFKLKSTRPDDDAEAYQALRGAYERVQQWLKWQQLEASQRSDTPADTPASTPDDTPQLADQPAEATTTREPAPQPMPPVAEEAADVLQAPRVQPLDLIDELELRWRRAGEAALLDAWAETRRELDQQPLNRQAEFSAAFAQWALALPALPDDFLKALDAHFGWLHDFRTERLLGAELAQALHEALDERLRPRPIDPAVRAVGAPLLRLQAWRQAGGGWLKLQWLWLLLQPVLARNQAMLGAQWLRTLGLDLEDQRWLRDGVKRGLWLRAGAAALAYVVVAMPVFGDPVIAIAHGLLWLAMTVLLLVFGLAGGRVLGLRLEAITPSARRLPLRLPVWCRDINGAALGPVWLLFAAGLFYIDAQPGPRANGSLLALLPDAAVTYAAWAFALGGIAMARPRHGLVHGVVMALAPLVVYLAVQVLGAWLPLEACIAVGIAWLLAGAAAHEERLGRPPATPLQWVLRPVLNTLALADRWTYGVAMTPPAVAMAYVTLVDGEVHPLRLFACWVVAILAVGWLQSRADALGQRQLPELAETS